MAALETGREVTPRATEILAQFPTRQSRLRAFDEQGLLISGQEAWLMLPESDEHLLLHRLGRVVIRYPNAGSTGTKSTQYLEKS